MKSICSREGLNIFVCSIWVKIFQWSRIGGNWTPFLLGMNHPNLKKIKLNFENFDSLLLYVNMEHTRSFKREKWCPFWNTLHEDVFCCSQAVLSVQDFTLKNEKLFFQMFRSAVWITPWMKKAPLQFLGFSDSFLVN